MCIVNGGEKLRTRDDNVPPREAIALARLMERELGYVTGHIDPIALRLFIRAHWTRISILAHAIHDDTDQWQPAEIPHTDKPPIVTNGI